MPLLEAALEALRGVEPFEPEPIEAALAPSAERRDVKPGKLYQPIRVAITGARSRRGSSSRSPSRARSALLERIERALDEAGSETLNAKG